MKKKRQINLIELEQMAESTEQIKFKEFYNNFQTAILLSLLEEKQLTKWQFDFCLDELEKQSVNSKNFVSCNKLAK